MASPFHTGVVGSLRPLHRVARDHVEVLGEASDIGPLAIIAGLVVDLGGPLRHAVVARVIAIPVERRAPVQTLVALDTGSGARGADGFFEVRRG